MCIYNYAEMARVTGVPVNVKIYYLVIYLSICSQEVNKLK